MKLLKTALLLALTAFICSSCSDDNDDNGNENGSAVEIASDYSFTGLTTTFPESDPADLFITDRGIYNVTIDKSAQTAEIIIEDAHFLAGMPDLHPMTFPDLSYVIAADRLLLNCDALTPTIEGRPFSAFPISDLSGEINPAQKTMKLTFTCGYRGVPYTVIFDSTKRAE